MIIKFSDFSSYIIYSFIIVLTILGIYLFNLNIQLQLSIFYSLLISVSSVCYVLYRGSNSSSWFYWLVIIYFVMYHLGTLVGVVFLDNYNFLSYRTNFSNFISNSSISKSYIVSGVAIGCLVLFFPFVRLYESKSSNLHFSYNPRLYNIGKFLVILTLPVVLFNLITQLQLVMTHGYAYLYTSAYQNAGSDVPISSVFMNLNKVGFLFVFASLAQKKKVQAFLVLFLIISLVDALKGSRTLLIVPILWVLFYRARYYNEHMKSKVKKILLGILGVCFLFLGQAIRSGQSVNFDKILGFLVFSISKAQYHLAVFIENRNSFEQNYPFLMSLLLFPVDYFKYGSQVVGQSETSAVLRTDLNHVMSSKLNYGAYLDGAGMGSALVSELFQYGIFLLPFLVGLFVSFYVIFFYLSSKYRWVFIFQPLLFMHVIFTPRDTALPNSWVYIKLGLIMFLIVCTYQLLVDVSKKRMS